VTSDLGWPSGAVSAMARTGRGALLVSALDGGAMIHQRGQLETVVPASALPRSPVISIAETTAGDVWMGTRDAGLVRSTGPRNVLVVDGSTDLKINCLLPGVGGHVWLGTDTGIVRWDGTTLTRAGLPRELARVRALALGGDRDGNIWIATASDGLLRLNGQGLESLDASGHDGRAQVTAVFEDAEGNLWTGGESGIERIRDGAFATYSTPEGLPSESVGPVHVDSQGRTWLAPVDGGLYRLAGHGVERTTAAGLDRDVVYSIDGRGGDLWLGRQRGGLTHLRATGRSFEAVTYTREAGLAQDSVYAVHQARDGAVWAGTISGGVSRLSGGRFTTYTTADGLASNTVTSILETADATMWFATPNGLSALAGGRWRVYGPRDGLPSAAVNCLFEDSAGVLWIGTTHGLAFHRDGRVEVARGAAVLGEPILGIVEDRHGALWLASASRVVRATRDVILRGEAGEGDVVEYGLSDGLRGVEGVKRHRSVVADPAGRVWISVSRGLAVVDPGRLAGVLPPVPVHIHAISADGGDVALGGAIRLPASAHRVTFDYTGVSLAVPERVRFRYRLEGFDPDWSAPTASREAVYTNLGPGTYRFHVIATNRLGLWNGPEAVVELTVAPAVWQMLWFQLACAGAAAAALFAAYRARVTYVARRLNRRFEERLAERTRIAQELHDTLLQGFISASMQLQVAADLVPIDSSARPRLARIVELMRQVIDEGRNAVAGLRSADVGGSAELGHAFARIREEPGVGAEVPVRVFVDGSPRALHPIIRDEVYRIGREAVVNAIRHARATSVEVELEYSERQLRVVVRDDGCGIAPDVLRSGRDGHWGLVGMNERAEAIGARLKIRSGIGAGTEVELSVPSSIAFRARAAQSRTSGVER
jgi:signal transduction histidine kinase/ligand-binding sensor domain-containing protein